MTRHESWKSYAIEGLVIVGSILLAFTIDTAWQARQESIQEREMLQFVLSEIRSNKATVSDLIVRSEIDQSSVERYFSHPENIPFIVSREEASAFFNSMYRGNAFDLSDSSLSGIVISGRVDSINNADVRQALESWGNLNRLLNNRTNAMRALSNESLLGLGSHNVYRTWNIQNGGNDGSQLDLTEVRADQRVLAAASAIYQQRRVNGRFLVTLGERLDVIEVLLSSYLNEF